MFLDGYASLLTSASSGFVYVGSLVSSSNDMLEEDVTNNCCWRSPLHSVNTKTW